MQADCLFDKQVCVKCSGGGARKIELDGLIWRASQRKWEVRGRWMGEPDVRPSADSYIDLGGAWRCNAE